MAVLYFIKSSGKKSRFRRAANSDMLVALSVLMIASVSCGDTVNSHANIVIGGKKNKQTKNQNKTKRNKQTNKKTPLHCYTARTNYWNMNLKLSLNRKIVAVGPSGAEQARISSSRPASPPRPLRPVMSRLLHLWRSRTEGLSSKQTNFCLVLLSYCESFLWSEPSWKEKQNAAFLRL